MHQDSLDAFDRLLRAGRIGQRDQQIFYHMIERQPLTDRACKEGLGYPDMNDVRPSITRWHGRWIFKEYDRVMCPHTGETVRRSMVAPPVEWDVPPPPPPAQEDWAGYDDTAVLTELKRELAQREHLYPRFIERGKLTTQAAATRLELMQLAVERFAKLAGLAVVVMLISSNLTYGGYTIVGQGMTWISCRAVLVNVGASAYYGLRGELRIRSCVAEPGDPES